MACVEQELYQTRCYVQHVISGFTQDARIRRKLHFFLNKNFVCKKCRSVVQNFKGPDAILCDGVETLSKFSHLDDRLNATGECSGNS